MSTIFARITYLGIVASNYAGSSDLEGGDNKTLSRQFQFSQGLLFWNVLSWTWVKMWLNSSLVLKATLMWRIQHRAMPNPRTNLYLAMRHKNSKHGEKKGGAVSFWGYANPFQAVRSQKLIGMERSVGSSKGGTTLSAAECLVMRHAGGVRFPGFSVCESLTTEMTSWTAGSKGKLGVRSNAFP